MAGVLLLSATAYLAVELRNGGAALLTHWRSLSILLPFAMAGAHMATRRNDAPLPRLALSFVLAALLTLPPPGGLLVGMIACAAGLGSGLLGPRHRSVSSFAVTAASLAAAQALFPLVLPTRLTPLSTLAACLLLFCILQAFGQALTLVLVAGEPDPAQPRSQAWIGMLLESANVPVAWLLADALSRRDWLSAIIVSAVLLAGEATILRLSRTLNALHRSNSALSSRLSELDTLHSMGREIVSSLDSAKVFAVIERECRKIFPADFCSIALADPESSRLISVYRRRGREPARSREVELDEGLARLVASEKRARRVDDLLTAPTDSPLRAGLIDPKSRSALSVPLIVDERVVGVLSIQCRAPGAYDDHGLSVLTTIAQQAAVAIDNARRYELATADSLTGFLLRDYFFKRLAEEHRRVARYGGTFSVLMMDLDGFKEINDRHGHLAGDDYLREVAVTIRAELRSADLACRYGGDEFCLLLPETELPGASAIAERIRRAIARQIVGLEGSALRATASIGVTAYPKHPASDVSALLRHADEALYRAKRAGRDRVRAYAA